MSANDPLREGEDTNSIDDGGKQSRRGSASSHLGHGNRNPLGSPISQRSSRSHHLRDSTSPSRSHASASCRRARSPYRYNRSPSPRNHSQSPSHSTRSPCRYKPRADSIRAGSQSSLRSEISWYTSRPDTGSPRNHSQSPVRSALGGRRESLTGRQSNRSFDSLPRSTGSFDNGSIRVYSVGRSSPDHITAAPSSSGSVTELIHDDDLDNDYYLNPFTANGIEVPHPRRYLLENKEPEDFMEPEQRDNYLKGIEHFQKQWDQGGSPNPPDFHHFMTEDMDVAYEEHLRRCSNQTIRYWKMKTRAWVKWLDREGIPFQVSCPRRGIPSVKPSREFEKDPVFEEMEAIEENLKHYDDFRWTAYQQCLMGNPRSMVSNHFQPPVTSV